MEQDKKNEPLCQRCGKSIKESEQKQGADKFCLQCAIEIAESRIPDTKIEALPQATPKNKFWQSLKVAVLLIFAVLTAVNTVMILKLLLAGRGPQEIMLEYSKDVELCRENVANIASGREIPDSLVCPISGQPYQISVILSDTVVRCPNPQTHKVIAIKASAKKPNAEVKK